jgi:hypothetical protein
MHGMWELLRRQEPSDRRRLPILSILFILSKLFVGYGFQASLCLFVANPCRRRKAATFSRTRLRRMEKSGTMKIRITITTKIGESGTTKSGIRIATKIAEGGTTKIAEVGEGVCRSVAGVSRWR